MLRGRDRSSAFECRVLDQAPTMLGTLAIEQIIGPTVALTLRRINKRTHKVIIGASGRFQAADTVLRCFKKFRLRPLVRLDISRKRFYIQTETLIGESPITDVLKKLLQLDNIFACVTAVLGQARLSIIDLNPEVLSVRYSRIGGHDLSFVVDLALPGNAHLTLLPANTNPHSLIQSHLEKLLNETDRPFSANLKIMLPLLAATHPLLRAFQQGTGDTGTPSPNSPSASTEKDYLSVTLPCMRYSTLCHPPQFRSSKEVRQEDPEWLSAWNSCHVSDRAGVSGCFVPRLKNLNPTLGRRSLQRMSENDCGKRYLPRKMIAVAGFL